MQIDFEVSGGGSVYLLQPLTRAARALGRRSPARRRDLVVRRGRRRAPLHRPIVGGAIGDRLGGAVMERLCVKTEAWSIRQQIEANEARSRTR